MSGASAVPGHAARHRLRYFDLWPEPMRAGSISVGILLHILAADPSAPVRPGEAEQEVEVTRGAAAFRWQVL